jgi:hypothetical protein
MPIVRGVHALLFEGLSASDVLARLMSRANRFEHTEVPIDAPAPVEGSVVERALAFGSRSGRGAGR